MSGRSWFVVMVGGLALAGAAGFWHVQRPAPVDGAPSEDRLSIAWNAVHHHPEDPGAWSHLAEIHAEMDQIYQAEHAYRTALRLGDESGLAYARLGFLVYGQGRDEEARGLLMEARRRGAQVPMLDFTLAALGGLSPDPVDGRPTTRSNAREPIPPAVDAGAHELDASQPVVATPPPARAPSRPAPAPPKVPQEPASAPIPVAEGPCTLPLVRRGLGLIVQVWINDVQANLLVDTGASMTVLTADLAARIGARVDQQKRIRAITANGRVEMPTALVDIELGPYRAERTRVAICDECVQDVAEGLLGLDMQAPFHVALDLGEGRLRFTQCP